MLQVQEIKITGAAAKKPKNNSTTQPLKVKLQENFNN